MKVRSSTNSATIRPEEKQCVHQAPNANPLINSQMPPTKGTQRTKRL